MQWINITWEVFVNTVEELLFLYLLLHQLEHDIKKRPYIIGGFVLKIFLLTFLNVIVINTTWCLIFSLFLDVLCCSLLFNGSPGKKLLWGSSSVVIALLADNITFRLANTFTDYELHNLILPGKTRVIMCLVYLLTYAALVFVLSRWRKKDLFLPVRFRVILALLICLGIVASDQLLSIIIDIDTAPNSSVLINRLEFISFIVLFIIFGFIVFIEYLGIVTKQNEHLRKEAALNALKKEHYETMETTLSTLRSWKHDYKTHLQVILNLAKRGGDRELEDFVSGLETNLVNTTPLIFTDNQILNALLSTKLLEFQKYSIVFSHEVYLVKGLPFDDIVFASLLGNLLDNALEACRCIEDNHEKYINFCIKPFHEMIYISVENSTTNRYSYHSDGTLKTTKKEAGHGIGLKRVQEIVSDVQGFCNIYPETNKFTAVIMLPLSETSEE